jgi:hypothetical protein
MERNREIIILITLIEKSTGLTRILLLTAVLFLQGVVALYLNTYHQNKFPFHSVTLWIEYTIYATKQGKRAC